MKTTKKTPNKRKRQPKIFYQMLQRMSMRERSWKRKLRLDLAALERKQAANTELWRKEFATSERLIRRLESDGAALRTELEDMRRDHRRRDPAGWDAHYRTLFSEKYWDLIDRLDRAEYELVQITGRKMPRRGFWPAPKKVK